jgi:hypothetical protein
MAICWKLRVSYFSNEISADNQQERLQFYLKNPQRLIRHAPVKNGVKIESELCSDVEDAKCSIVKTNEFYGNYHNNLKF